MRRTLRLACGLAAALAWSASPTAVAVADPRVDYMLSAAGNELIPVMQAMCAWGTKHLGVQPNLPHPMAVPA